MESRGSGCLASSQVGISETDLVTGERTSFFLFLVDVISRNFNGDILPFFNIEMGISWGFNQNGGFHPEIS